MKIFDLGFYTNNIKYIGVLSLFISVVAWAVDLTGMVYECPYCRTQRTVIGLLGIIMLMPNPTHWILKYLASVLAFFGAFVAASQNFMGWKKISGGTFTFNEQIYIDPFILSGCALFFIIGQAWLLLLAPEPKGEVEHD